MRMTAADFARRRRVNRATVTKWDARGLVVRAADGLIEVEATEARLDQRPAKYRGGVANRPTANACGNGNGVAGNSSATATRATPANPYALFTEPKDFGAFWLARALVRRIGAVGAMAALEEGAELQVAYGLERALPAVLIEVVEDVFREHAIGPFAAEDSQPAVWPSEEAAAYSVHWANVAKARGEVADTERWARERLAGAGERERLQ